jgi:hypothetical protein
LTATGWLTLALTRADERARATDWREIVRRLEAEPLDLDIG